MNKKSIIIIFSVIFLLIILAYIGANKLTVYSASECSPLNLDTGDKYYGYAFDCLNCNPRIEDVYRVFLSEEEMYNSFEDYLDSLKNTLNINKATYDFAECTVGSYKPTRCQNNYATCKTLNYEDLKTKYSDEIVIRYYFSDNGCSLKLIKTSNIDENYYEVLSDCEKNIIKKYYNIIDNKCIKISKLASEKSYNDYDTYEECEKARKENLNFYQKIIEFIKFIFTNEK